MIDWKAEIVKAALIHQRIEELDRGQLWQRQFPEVAAGESDMAAAETGLGFRLDPKYRAFLRHANGWRRFYQDVDLFGTRNLLGASPMDAAIKQLDAIDDVGFEVLVGEKRSNLLPIAASAVQMDMFLIGRPLAARPGAVTWLAGGVIDTYEDFDAYFLSMQDYNRREVSLLDAEDRGR